MLLCLQKEWMCRALKKKQYIYMRWVQVSPGVTLVKLHIFYTVDL